MTGRFIPHCEKHGGERRVFMEGGHVMVISPLLFILLIVVLIAALPAWPYSRGWGYYPSGGLGFVVVLLLILWLLGVI